MSAERPRGAPVIRCVQALRTVPAGPRQGQLRPALLGWQYRISRQDRISRQGADWGPWMFAYGPRRRALERLERLGPIWIEEEAR